MKRFVISTLFALLLTALPFSFGWGQDEGVKTKVFYGLNWESNIGFISGAAFDLPLGFKTYPYVRFGLDTGSYENGLQTDKSVGFEVGFTIKETARYSLSLLAGTAVDWTAPTTEIKNWTTYVPQSAGLLGTWTLPEGTPLLGWVLPPPFGLAGWVKFRPQIFEAETLWQDKFTAGIALFGSV